MASAAAAHIHAGRAIQRGVYVEGNHRAAAACRPSLVYTCPGSVLLIDFLCENWLNTTEKH
jgi:hypothetical protein